MRCYNPRKKKKRVKKSLIIRACPALVDSLFPKACALELNSLIWMLVSSSSSEENCVSSHRRQLTASLTSVLSESYVISEAEEDSSLVLPAHRAAFFLWVPHSPLSFLDLLLYVTSSTRGSIPSPLLHRCSSNAARSPCGYRLVSVHL